MNFETGHIYHIFNQGNNRQRVFFQRENYLFFLKKTKLHILPFADIFAWCLMPNHFHLMVFVNHIEVFRNEVTHEIIAGSTEIDRVTGSHPVNGQGFKKQSINQAIAIMLRSYTRAINKQQGFSGSLFREGTKAECVTKTEGITPSFIHTGSGTKINVAVPEKQYPQLCFNYIHQNPVEAGLVMKATDWEFSSARDFAGLRDGKLINKKRAEEYLISTGVESPGNWCNSPGDFQSPGE
ncbi:MAG: hypothetical protein U5Q03_09015 [Bacteroidota bacterium]|nr:hypothetical protein [Bacteroidota bacterium]